MADHHPASASFADLRAAAARHVPGLVDELSVMEELMDAWFMGNTLQAALIPRSEDEFVMGLHYTLSGPLYYSLPRQNFVVTVYARPL